MISAQDEPERVGNFTFTIQPAEHTPESQARWDDRANALADLLMELWEKEQLRELAERN